MNSTAQHGPTHNVVMTFSNELSETLIAHTQSMFDAHAEGYCIGESSIPHVTLAQFTAQSHDFDTLTAKLDCAVTQQDTLDCLGFNLRVGTGQHDGFIWAELVIDKTQGLHDFHYDICDAIHNAEHMLFGKVKDAYYPHLTLCRLPVAALENMDQVALPDAIAKADFSPKRIAFGQSDMNGQFLNILWDKPLPIAKSHPAQGFDIV